MVLLQSGKIFIVSGSGLKRLAPKDWLSVHSDFGQETRRTLKILYSEARQEW